MKMFTETNKGFTIITNFGCGNHCKYCISKHHPILQNQKTDINNIDFNYLEQCIQQSTSPKVNLSGGGDPFYNYKNNKEFYFKIFKLCQKYNKLLDTHSRIIPDELDFINMFNKIALSIEYDDEKAIDELKLKYKLIKLHTQTKIRIIQVVNSKLTINDCITYIDKLKDIGIKQITFRQMFGNKKAYEHFNYLKDNVPDYEGVMFLKDGEYHEYYFTTNNKLYPYFFGYTENDRFVWMKKYEELEQSCN
jgi:organic radical activating enzyme